MQKQKKISFSCLNNCNKGSILAYTLILVFLMFSIVSTISFISVLEKSGASSSQSSVQTFQVADSGAQLAIKKINSVLTSSNNKISDAFPGCVVDSSSGTNVATSNNVDLGASMPYTLSFYQSNGSIIGDCNSFVSSISEIKSVGSYKGTVRAVRVTSIPVSCADGIQGGTETGVDCGGICPNAC